MVRKCILNRNKKVEFLVEKYAKKRKELKDLIKKSRFDSALKKNVMKNVLELDALPKGSSKIKFRNRCLITGRSRGLNNYKFFGMCSFKIREKANIGDILGLKKF